MRASNRSHPTGGRPALALANRTGALALWLAAVALVLAACSSGSAQVPTPTPSQWRSADIGAVVHEGDVETGDDGTVVVRASGTDVWNEADGFRFTYQEMDGDGSLTVRVDGIVAANEWTKVGVMVRENLNPGSRNAFMLLTDFYGVVFQGRLTTDGTTSDTLPDGHVMRTAEPKAPWWLRIERQGSTLIGSHSPNGTDWSELGRLTIDLPKRVLIGMGVTSRNPDEVATGVFSNLVLQRDAGGDDTTLPPVPITGPTTSATYTRTTALFPNPERGFYTGGGPDNYARAASGGYTLVMRYVRLDDYRNSALPASFLNQLSNDLSGLRAHGLKVILRFSYNFGFTADAPRDRVLQHIEQLTPVLQAHTDVIAVLQAGFIGAWGEWHSSTNNLLTRENRSAIANALLGAMDSSRMIQIRTPYHARDLFALPTAATAFGTSASARVGQVNDCFLTNASDAGTFLSGADWTYAEAVSRYTVQGGETCEVGGLNARNDGATAVAEMARFHYDYLNHDYWSSIVNKWRTQGYFDEISRRLGYRYVLEETVAQSTATAGDTYSLNVRVHNEGFGKLYNPRPIQVVLRPVGGGAAIVARASDDARRLLPLAGETVTMPLTIRVPAGTAAGRYDVFLALPDASASLAGDARYALRFANDGVWNATTGSNALNVQLEVR